MPDLPHIAFWMLMTLAIWQLCCGLARRLPFSVFQNPLFTGILCLCAFLPLLGTRPEDYLAAVKPLTFLVSLATVALALPLWRQRTLIRANAAATLVASLAATSTGVASGVSIGWLLGLDLPVLASMGPKMTTLAVALPLSRSTGGWDNLAMLCVMCNGVGGSFIASEVWRWMMPKTGAEERAFALGTTSHAMGIARTLAIDPEHVALASCGMLLSALMTVALYSMAILTYGLIHIHFS